MTVTYYEIERNPQRLYSILYYIYLKCHLCLSCLLYYIHSIRIRHMHDGVFKADRQQFIR